ncbi:hypothetical protein [Sulfuriflexus mobilis]|uniref:hypothetical protein n=1 Tax=Sulfuriflexus mobilis TaxID=1811807 RepID=UPI001559A467|nr:hypothetical protein [Sulfuriflexus mobilis]
MKLFIPITDELIFDHPELICEPLVPFSLDYECHRYLDGVESADSPDKENSDEQNYNR